MDQLSILSDTTGHLWDILLVFRSRNELMEIFSFSLSKKKLIKTSTIVRLSALPQILVLHELARRADKHSKEMKKTLIIRGLERGRPAKQTQRNRQK